jgi:MFS transporter, DHA2 family, multidrug resistance protein
LTTKTPGGEILAISPKAYARRWKTLVVLSLSLLIIGLDNTILNVALPSLQEEFDASTSTLQWMVDSYLLVFAGLLLTMGTLGDRFGRKLALQFGLVLFGGASLCVLLVDTSTQLIAVRSVMGVGGALIMPATLSVISNVFPREERAKAIGIWSAMAAVGIGLGPFFGGLLLEYFSWTSVFLINVPVAGLALLLSFWLVPESRDPKPGAFDFLGAGLSIAALVTLVFGLIEAPDAGWTDPVILGCFAAAALFSVAFVRWELRVAEPMLNLSFFRDPRFSIASMGLGIASFSLFGAIFGTTQFLQDAHGYSALGAGAVMVPIALGMVMGAGSSSIKLVPKFGARRIIMLGLIGQSVVLASTNLWSPDTGVVYLCFWFYFLAFFMGWVMAPATASVMGSVPAEKSGVASAMNDVTRQVGGAIGTAVIGSLITTLYASRIDDSTGALSESSRTAAEESIGQANAVADSVGGSTGSQLTSDAADAFTYALGHAFTVGAFAALAGAVLVRRFLPGKPAEEPVVEAEPLRNAA